MIPTATGRIRRLPVFLALCAVLLLFGTAAEASVGDRLPEFRDCVEVRDHRARDGQSTWTGWLDLEAEDTNLALRAGLQAGEL